jgi:hypothetical protein
MIKGLKKTECKKITLDQYFDDPGTFVTVQPLRPYAKALCNELMLEGAEVEERKKAASKKTRIPRVEKGLNPKPVKVNEKSTAIRPVMSAENTLEIRKIKLQYGVVEHNISDGTGTAEWGPELWDEIDEMNPLLLDYIVEQINELSFAEVDPF